MEDLIRKLIREEINRLFEIMDFQSAAAEQIATNMSLFRLPRKGIDDSINIFNQVQFDKDKEKNQEEKEAEPGETMGYPAFNTANATTRTNIYESEKEVKESYGIYGSTDAAQQNLDWERLPEKKTGEFSKEAEAEFDMHNDNINRSLHEVPPGDCRTGAVVNNKTKNF